MNEPVNLEIAKLLKEKGFDEWTKLCVADDDDRALPFDAGNSLHKNSLHPYYSAPTICEVLMWMYEKHGIWISVFENEQKSNFNWKLIPQKDWESVQSTNILLTSPSLAYENAIGWCLNTIL